MPLNQFASPHLLLPNLLPHIFLLPLLQLHRFLPTIALLFLSASLCSSLRSCAIQNYICLHSLRSWSHPQSSSPDLHNPLPSIVQWSHKILHLLQLSWSFPETGWSCGGPVGSSHSATYNWCSLSVPWRSVSMKICVGYRHIQSLSIAWPDHTRSYPHPCIAVPISAYQSVQSSHLLPVPNAPLVSSPPNSEVTTCPASVRMVWISAFSYTQLNHIFPPMWSEKGCPRLLGQPLQVKNLPILVYCFEITGMIPLIYLKKRTIK